MLTKKRKKKKSLQGIFFQVLFGLFAVALAVFLVISNLRIKKRRQELTSQIEALQKEIQVLGEKNQRLKAGVLQTESESYLEKEARERLGLKKSGEELVAIKKIESEEESKEVEKETKAHKLKIYVLGRAHNALCALKSFWEKVWEKIRFWRD